jgi:hypothetical protein
VLADPIIKGAEVRPVNGRPYLKAGRGQ